MKMLLRSAKVLIFGSALAALPVGMAAGQSTCEDVLNSNVYSCEVKSDFGTQFEDTFRFVSPGNLSEDFDLTVDGLPGQIQGCECKARGRFRNPIFNASPSFHCVSGSGVFLGISFEGRATSRRIRRGEAVNEFGNSFVIQCELEDPDDFEPPPLPIASPGISPGNWSSK